MMSRYAQWMTLTSGMIAILFVISSCKREPADKPQTSETSSAAPAAGSASDQAPLPITLPAAMFVGTPSSMKGVTNLEAPLGHDRPPFLAPRGAVNVALHKPVTSSSSEPLLGTLAMITDGDKEATDGSLVELDPMVQSITIDLGAEYDIYAVLVWHFHQQERVYFDVVVQVSSDPDFIEAQTLFNNDADNSDGQGAGSDKNYVETNEGKLIDGLSRNARGRYVRLYSNGNNQNDLNHYLEVEVYGKPVP